VICESLLEIGGYAANGHAAAAPLTKMMNSRRLIVGPEARIEDASNSRAHSGRG
jgi:hypothetical protein